MGLYGLLGVQPFFDDSQIRHVPIHTLSSHFSSNSSCGGALHRPCRAR